MKDGKFWLQTLEWVGAVTLAAVLTALGAGVHDTMKLVEIGAAAASAALVKCLIASRTGEGTPALVEADPVIRPVVVPEPVKAFDPGKATVRPIPPQGDRWS